jgi:hypothetical protein
MVPGSAQSRIVRAWRGGRGALGQGRCQGGAGQRQAATPKPGSQAIARPRQPALDGADRPAEVARGLLAGQALKVAQDDGDAVLLRQLIHLLVKDRLPVAQVDAVRRRRLSHVGHLSFVGLPSCGGDFDGPGDVEGHAVQPGGQRLLLANRAGLARKHEERRLESVLGVRPLAQRPAADREHQRAMPLQERREGVLIPLGDELLKQGGVVGLSGAGGMAEKSEYGP